MIYGIGDTPAPYIETAKMMAKTGNHDGILTPRSCNIIIITIRAIQIAVTKNEPISKG